MNRDMAGIEQDEVAQWVARMDADRWTDEDELELQGWLAADPRREGELLRTQARWISLDTAGTEVGQPRPLSFRRRAFLATCGGAMAASLAGIWLFASPLSYETEVGEIRRVALLDGSVATVNTASKIAVALGERERRIRLERGEAWFQVAKSPDRPFLVEAGDVHVRAVGTAFSVRRLDRGSEVMVTEGVVEIWCGNQIGARVPLRAGERAFVSDTAVIRRQTAMDSSIDRSLAWRSGKIDLLGDSLESAIEEFNRYNRRKLVLLDPKFGSEQLDGVFRIDDVEGFARTVGKALAVPVDTSNANEVRIG